MDENEIVVDGIEYVRKACMEQAKDKGMQYVIVRTRDDRVFAGFLKIRKWREVCLLQARRLWYWHGAESLSQLAMNGTKDPRGSTFRCVVSEIVLMEVSEILSCTEMGRKSIEEIPIWGQ